MTQAIKSKAGYQQSEGGQFIARERHLQALDKAEEHLLEGNRLLKSPNTAELLAEELLMCQRCLDEITGQVTSDDLLGMIFGSFCIGK